MAPGAGLLSAEMDAGFRHVACLSQVQVSSRISPVLVCSDGTRPCTDPVGTKRRQTTGSSRISTDISPKSVGKCRRTLSGSAALMFRNIPSAASAASRTCGDEGSTTEWCHVLGERHHGTEPKRVGAARRHRDEHAGSAAKLGAYGRDPLVQVGSRRTSVLPGKVVTAGFHGQNKGTWFDAFR